MTEVRLERALPFVDAGVGVLARLSLPESLRSGPSVQAASGLGGTFDRLVSSDSEGMRARPGFASADETGPTILPLDEAHEALDHEYRAHVQERARQILSSGGIVVAAGHDHPLLEQLATDEHEAEGASAA